MNDKLKSIIKVSDRERKCLEVLADHYDEYGDGCNYIYFRTIVEDTGMLLKDVRRSVRALARKGLAEYMRGLFDDEGFTAGSGYGATEVGKKFIEETKKLGEQKELIK